jgi:hypothetical protein
MIQIKVNLSDQLQVTKTQKIDNAHTLVNKEMDGYDHNSGTKSHMSHVCI